MLLRRVSFSLCLRSSVARGQLCPDLALPLERLEHHKMPDVFPSFLLSVYLSDATIDVETFAILKQQLC